MNPRITFGYFTLLVLILIGINITDRDMALFFGVMKEDQPELVAIFQSYTDLGKAVFYLVPLGLYMLAGAWLAFRRPQERPLWLRRLQIAGFIFANLAVSGLMTDLFKILIGRPRPVLLFEQNIFNHFDFGVRQSRWWSMPSGHATTGMSLALAVGTLWPLWRWPLLLFAGLIAASRVIVTAHYGSDVLAGIGMACLCFSLLLALFERRGWDGWRQPPPTIKGTFLR